ncbi:MAG TPA: phenylalanine--tRNA ligase subunit beta [Saprospiraceae bacterium]|nr:phenylalanine--tRNA ligase subunit beta [Saprospiraceae bacterium]
MKISLNWLREYLDIDKTPPEIADILTSLGLEVDGWSVVKPSPVDLDQVLTGHVVECAPIPDTDHLSATQVDVGDGKLRSIVCGAPNVAAGQKVLVALPGANVYSKDGTLFTIGERKVRGVPSQGMICADDELGIGHDHSGIKVLPPDTALGIRASDLLGLPSDIVYEIGLTPNRADATHHLGVARDLLAWMRMHENPAATLRDVDLEGLENFPEGAAPYAVEVRQPAACPRYMGLTISGIRVGESPEWLKNRLLAVGQRPINNVVDVTNYVRIELGQPLHAFDLDKIGGQKIIVQTLPAGTPFRTLDGVERKLLAEDLMICDGNGSPMCMGGVFGGAESGVSESTTAIFLESAIFHPTWIRRSMLRHGLRTDAAWSFEKGVDPDDCGLALFRAALLIERLSGGRVSSQEVDISADVARPARVRMRYARINTLIGVTLSPEEVARILDALCIGIEEASAEGFVAVVPTNKPDVTREADVVEEILRIYGLDNVPIPTHIRSSMEITPRPNPDAVRNFASDMLAANGFYECMSLSLSNSAYYTGESAVFPIDRERIVYVHNTANQGLDCLRPPLLFGLLEAVRNNQNRQKANLRLFEFGKVYEAQPDVAGGAETYRLCVAMTGAYAAESWHPSSKKWVDFYTLKSYVANLLTRLGISGFQESTVQQQGFQYALRYHRGPQELVTFGAVHPALLKKMDVKNAVYYADFHFEHLLKALASNRIQYAETNRFPAVRRDLALVLDEGVTFGEIKQLAGRTVKKLLKEVNLFDVFEEESRLGPGKKSYAVSFVFEDPDKTLQDKEIEAVMGQLQQAFEGKLGAVVRR